ncbi:DeoR/GlpR family DNA-binding transcription regulator [Companilactobacillus metriopterae]|uniref:DeoR/GlpR family DNA-binding transcription regulator n=1 Tax=Companilactobacillus metriopterae TaxID=1909267 RepID=UPI001F506463|nr:DeoR/GlpR family DNA-binding transcription regulator [Companilactobacillus metriopterae]
MFEVNKTKQKRGDFLLKKERFIKILSNLDEKNVITVNDLTEKLNVSDMTIRRDLDELASSGKLIRIHGGAQKINSTTGEEASIRDKRSINLKEKQEIAKIAANEIKDFETIFIGPGTTLELIAQYIKDVHSIRVITISVDVFQSFINENVDCELILTGGTYRKRSGTLIGTVANNTIESLKFDKAFIGVNGIKNADLMTANTEEGELQNIALNNSTTKYITADKHKLNKNDFYVFYNLTDADYLITNKNNSYETIDYYQQYVSLLTEIRRK